LGKNWILLIIPIYAKDTNKNKQTTSIQTFLENIFEKFNNWNESEKQKIML
jgi:hypothetical protein